MMHYQKSHEHKFATDYGMKINCEDGYHKNMQITLFQDHVRTLIIHGHAKDLGEPVKRKYHLI